MLHDEAANEAKLPIPLNTKLLKLGGQFD